MIDVGCFSHTLDQVGEQFKLPIAEEFTRLWISLFSQSSKARLAWRSHCGRAVPTYSETRWWSCWEETKQILEGFPDVENFVQASDNLAPATVKKLTEILTDQVKKTLLKVELAMVIDGWSAFCQRNLQSRERCLSYYFNWNNRTNTKE